MAIGVFSKETAEQIYQWYRDTQGNTNRPDTFRYPDDWRQPWYLVKLTEDLAAAEDPLKKFTQAKSNALKYTDADNLYRVEVTDTDYEILVTNRLPIEYPKDSYVWVKRIGAEYVPFSGGESEQSGIELSHGLIIEQCNAACSTYRVQRVRRFLLPTCDDDYEYDSGS
jgi:hypothetical protein